MLGTLTRTHACAVSIRRERGGERPTHESVGSAGAQHVEGDAGLRVEVQPPLIVLLGEDEIERVPRAPLLGRLHQMLELHPRLAPSRCLPSASSSFRRSKVLLDADVEERQRGGERVVASAATL